MLNQTHKTLCVLILLVIGGFAHVDIEPFANKSPVGSVSGAGDACPTVQIQSDSLTTGPEKPADFLVDDNQLVYNGHTVEKRVRKAQLNYAEHVGALRDWVDVSYVVVKKGGKVLRRFDADLLFPLGNSANFGMFPFLGGNSQQVFINEDVPRGGCQWIVSLSPRFRIIFDGHQYGVGREGDDLKAIEIDGDGVFEITVPITDFYGLQDKMSISQIPLPEIVFKYDPSRRQYLPANPRFQNYLLKDFSSQDEVSTADQFAHRGTVVAKLLTLVYAGREQEGWAFYEKTYQLSDKAEIRRRVKSILFQQPVYKFIYNHPSYK